MTDINPIDVVAPVLDQEPIVPTVTQPESEVAPEEKQITLTQTALDNLIKSRQSAVLKREAKLQEEVQRLREVASGQGADATELQRIRGELAASKIERDAIAAAAAQSKKETFIAGQIQKQGFVCDSNTLFQLTANDLTYDETTKTFTTLDGQSADEYFRQFAENRKYLVRSTVLPGAGGIGSHASAMRDTSLQPEAIFGAKSDAKLANQVALRDKGLYDRLKIQARAKGLIV